MRVRYAYIATVDDTVEEAAQSCVVWLCTHALALLLVCSVQQVLPHLYSAAAGPWRQQQLATLLSPGTAVIVHCAAMIVVQYVFCMTRY